MVPQLDEYVEYIEDVVVSSVHAVTPDLPIVREAFGRLWADVNRLWPTAVSEMKKIPGLSDFEIEMPPPPPPPPPKTWIQNAADWSRDHPYKAATIGLGVVGVGLLAGYSVVSLQRTARMTRLWVSSNGERRLVVVVLGGDTPLGLPLILELERQGYIVIASVSTPEAADALERKCHGYVRALVLDPSEPATIHFFSRSLTSALSRRFPLSASGDPHVSPSAQPHLHSIISLLTLPSQSPTPSTSTFENLPIDSAYHSYLTATHITPLQAIQALLPLLRSTSARDRARERDYYGLAGSKSIIFCVPATDARIGLPFAAAKAMSAAATLRGAEVLRRELRASSVAGSLPASTDTRVVVVDIGAIDVPSPRMPEVTERSLVLSDNASMPRPKDRRRTSRKPTDARKYARTVVDIVNGGRPRDPGYMGWRIVSGSLLNWIRGNRVVVGAGAGTYALASYLPISVLDLILNIPHLLIGLRNALLPVPPRVAIPSAPPSAPVAPRETPVTSSAKPTQDNTDSHGSGPQAPSNHDHDHEQESLSGSEADVESNTEQEPVMTESWVSLGGNASELSVEP
ncbi:hypothetical protein PUNSTDRAFT_53579 [Punctularia strigosozonata HHB-11173 SS5]|uniref:uncharacterized protein n=1 Tax=Punctularia strigosozonata (strain HHB-11173) TaxID=741275 RepID=UPI000441847A|nr:uncharacterized protein PUNSTDRAFT_53579 [Punctularia strigosozonata HHB-11173 SS5]EIN07208.1 hypothetical protein PUNSTDRAFT_53579 [Punctularia strigosozonata HHB-11173 SS5]